MLSRRGYVYWFYEPLRRWQFKTMTGAAQPCMIPLRHGVATSKSADSPRRGLVELFANPCGQLQPVAVCCRLPLLFF